MSFACIAAPLSVGATMAADAEGQLRLY
jgi:hypothetical protein